MPLHTDGYKIVKAKDRNAWRAWLQKNWDKEDRVWLHMFNKGSKTKSVNYNDAVEEALCFGWIDSKPNKFDHESRIQLFAPRNPKSKWSSLNHKRVDKMIAEGKMTEAGLKLIHIAKQTGTWTALQDVENNVIPDDLSRALNKNKKALEHFNKFPPSSKRIILSWISDARRDETRQKRIQEAVSLAAQNIRANHYRQPTKKNTT